jgi:hypothetical protein
VKNCKSFIRIIVILQRQTQSPAMKE